MFFVAWTCSFQTFTCSDLAVNETKEAVLAIEGMNLVTKQPLDFEIHPFLTVTLSCTGRDLKGNEISVAGELKIAVVDVNEPPSEIRVYGGGWVDENSPSDTLVTRLNTVDPEPYQNYTYSILGVAAGLDPTATDPALLDVFTVEGRALKVGKRAELLNHEATPLFSLTLRSTDDGTPPLSVNATVTVEVKDVNEPPTSVALDSHQVAENSAVDTVVGHLAVSDEDKGQQHTCQVTNLEDVPFTVKNKLDLVVSRADIDYEKARTYVVKVSCQDEGGDDTHLRVTSSLTINVTDVNEAPYDVRLSKESVPENSPAGQVVREIMATDPDSHKVTFWLESGSDHFKIDGDNTLTAVSTFNYEELTTVPVSIRATDDEGLHTVKEFLIQIEDMNDPPSNLSLSDHVVSESTPPGAQVALLVTEDPDRGQTFTFDLAPDPTVDGHLDMSGNKLIVGKLGLDYETSAVFHIKITAVDSGTPPLNIMKEFNLTVTDANEAPTDIVTTPIPPIQENVTVPHVLTSLYVIDQEREQRHSCNLVGSHGPLAVETDEDGNMTLVVQGHLDYETAQRYDVIVSCSDGQYDVKKNVSVQVIDVNEPPTLLTLSGPQALPASVTGHYEVGRLTVTDQDLGQSHTLVLKGPNSDILTVRSDNTLVLTKAVPLSVLATPTPQVTFTIIATDNGRPPLSLQQHFTLPVTDVDVRQLQLPRITLSNGVVSEDAVRGTEVGALYDLNTTLSDTVVFTLVKDDENLFEIKDDRVLVLSRNMSSFTGRSAEVTLQARNTRTGEKVKRTITVLVKRSDKCYRDGRTCDENARCVALNDTVSQCQCDQDFKGDGYTCDEVNDCVGQDGSSPCQHGECVDGIQDFRCVCRHGYSGPRCEMEQDKADPCTSNPCSNGAACQPDVTNTTFTCTCRAGWEGQRCAKSVDDCLTGRCHGNGSNCDDQYLTFLCRCSDDRHGPRCEYLKAACPENTCGGTEVCTPVPDQAEHTCAPALRTVVFVIDCRKHGITNLQLCEMRFLDFVRTYGRFPENSKSPPPAKKQTAFRMKRAASGAPYTKGVHVYRVESTHTSDGQLNVSLLALDVDNLVFSKEEVLSALHATCHSIRSDQLTEGVFCPAIDQAYRAEVKELKPAEGGDGGGEGESGGLPIGIIGGAGGGGVVIIIIIVVVVVVIKKKKKNTDGATNQHQSMENLSPSEQPTEHLDYDLNRVGESSITSSSSTFTPEGSKATPDHKATPGEETKPKTLAL
ncbi:hypothetical protein V1264_019607 [Littorina saxatilis]|uniref:Uncharacterized protein n=1 Tax=Littorina saxatilis TaxID=31220 RepID=A0AAN9GFK5_9CAEN